jgi:membrane protein YqaA with SNARE-associated domain
MSRSLQLFLPLGPLFIGLGVSIVFVFFIGTEVLIDYVGLQNAYILMFLVAALGGVSTFNSVPYLALLVVLATAGVNPILLGLASALGVMSGDSFSFLMGRQGSALLPISLQPFFTLVKKVAENRPRLFLCICFFYGALCPLSNDFITIAAGMARITYRHVMIPLALGNIVFNISVVYLSLYATHFMSSIL